MKIVTALSFVCILIMILGCGGNSENIIECDKSTEPDGGGEEKQSVDGDTYCPRDLEPLMINPADDMPGSSMVVGGDGNFYEFARYMVFNPNKNIVMADSAWLLQTNPLGHTADFDTVKINGDQKGRLFGNTSIGDLIFVHAIVNPLVFQPNETVLIEVKAMMADPIKGETEESLYGYPRVGHTPALKLVDLAACLTSIANIADHTTNPMTLVACQDNCASD